MVIRIVTQEWWKLYKNQTNSERYSTKNENLSPTSNNKKYWLSKSIIFQNYDHYKNIGRWLMEQELLRNLSISKYTKKKNKKDYFIFQRWLEEVSLHSIHI